MQGDFVVNVTKLRDQSDKFKCENNIANHLSTMLKTAQNQASPEKANVYRKLINQANDLSKFYLDMSNGAATTANDIANLLSKFKAEFEDNAIDNTKRFNLNG